MISPGGLNPFETQKIFRCLLDCIARPGKIDILTRVNFLSGAGAWSYAAAVAFTLLDREVTFSVLGYKNQEEKTNYLALATGSRAVDLPEADYILAPGERELPQLALVKRGTLECPDKSATIILTIDKILPAPLPGKKGLLVNLSGPGVLKSNQLFLSGLHSSIFAHFNALNGEYPLGVDYVLLDSDGAITCFPRATQIEETAWDKEANNFWVT
jgi:alpha-D-ribose 1-methylphosphonate 5-triphosphate synthase subunit PhnH